MKTKIFGILVVTMLITTVLPVMGLVEDNEIKAVAISTNKDTNILFNRMVDSKDALNLKSKGKVNMVTMLDELDQEQIGNCGWGWGILPTQWIAQGFTPTLEILTRVELKLFKAGNPQENIDFTVSIRSSLDGNDLQSKTIDASLISSTSGSWYEFDFENIEVTPGVKYYILCRANGGGAEADRYCWLYDVDDPYKNGAAWSSHDEGDSWNYAATDEHQDTDCCFKTYGSGNIPPTVSITSPSPGATVSGTSVPIQGTASDSDGSVQQVEVKIDSGGSWWTASGTTSWSTTWDSTTVSDGPHTIYARSKDDKGAYSTMDSVNVTVSIGGTPPNTPDRPSGPPSGEGRTGYPYPCSTKTTDPDGDQVKYGWEWGDGSPIEWTTEFYSSGTTVYKDHTFDLKDTYNIMVKAEDTDGEQSSFSLPLQVHITDCSNNGPDTPEKPSGDTNNVKVNEEHKYTFVSTDPDGDDVYYKIDWGSGTIDQIVGPHPSGEPQEVPHTWIVKGTKVVRVKAEDNPPPCCIAFESDWSDTLYVTVDNKSRQSHVILSQFLKRAMECFPLWEQLLKFIMTDGGY